MLRLLVVVTWVLALTPTSATACPASANPCRKYWRRTTIPATAYVHSIKGAIPAWSEARITRLLTSGSWEPVLPRADAYPVGSVPPNRLTFRRGDEEEFDASESQLVIVRRLEKQSGVRLVEIDGVPWKLVPCARKKGYACLVPAGTMTFSEVE